MAGADEELERLRNGSTWRLGDLFHEFFCSAEHSELEVRQAADIFKSRIEWESGEKMMLWDRSKARDDIRQFISSVRELRAIYDRLPNPVRSKLEELFQERRFRFSLKMEIDGHRVDALLLPFLDELQFRLTGRPPEGYDGMFGKHPNTIDGTKALEAVNQPASKYNGKRSEQRWLKVSVIEHARMEWRHFKKREAPKSLNAAPSPDPAKRISSYNIFITELFGILGIEDNPRAAHDEWRKSKSTGSTG